MKNCSYLNVVADGGIYGNNATLVGEKTAVQFQSECRVATVADRVEGYITCLKIQKVQSQECLRNRSAPAVNYCLIIHCLEVSCKEDQIMSA